MVEVHCREHNSHYNKWQIVLHAPLQCYPDIDAQVAAGGRFEDFCLLCEGLFDKCLCFLARDELLCPFRKLFDKDNITVGWHLQLPLLA